MRAWIALFLAAALCAAAAAQDEKRVASVLAQDITRGELAADADDLSRTLRLLELIWRRVVPHYVAQQGLAATATEVAEVAAYDREFEHKDRSQRARKLEELNQRLGKDSLSPAERAWLVEFRAVLQRRAQNDLEKDRLAPPGPGQQRVFYAPWIEMWKMNKALYEQYGGAVVLTELGPSPHGARAALISDYERQGRLRFFDAALRERLYALIEARPSSVVPPERVDFTPYWKRPIPPSYFPDEKP